MAEGYQNKTYGKRSLWQWIIIYLIIGAIIYGLVYYFFLSNNTGFNPLGY